MSPVQLWNRAQHPPRPVLNPRGAFREAWKANTFVAQPPLTIPPAPPAPVKWKDIDAISIGINFYEVDAVAFRRIKVTARDLAGVDEVLIDINYDDNNYDQGHLILAVDSDSVVFPIRHPPPPTPLAPKAAEEIVDEVKKQALFAHLNRYRAHYTRTLALHENAAERARRLDEIKLSDGTSLLDHLENRPLEVLGDFVAYPCTDLAWSKKIREAVEPEATEDAPLNERLITLPTRGVFAEAKLGHCNASEEIDNTRFWDWQTSPIPHFAPEIAPTVPVTPQPQEQNVSPTPFPSSLVDIVNPPNAPDPTAMASALSLLGTPNIFRDMSGRAEVAQLLGKLSDNSIGIAEAANRAREIQSKYGGASGGAGGGGVGGAGLRRPESEPDATVSGQSRPARPDESVGSRGRKRDDDT